MSEATYQYSNFVTPPDFVEDKHHTVVLIDVSREDIEHIAQWAQTATQSYNVYIFEHSMIEHGNWLLQALDRADACVVNTIPTTLSEGKDKLAETGRAWYYGPKRFFKNGKTRIDTPLDYFVNYDKSVK